jgi:hypothetical protein
MDLLNHKGDLQWGVVGTPRQNRSIKILLPNSKGARRNMKRGRQSDSTVIIWKEN